MLGTLPIAIFALIQPATVGSYSKTFYDQKASSIDGKVAKLDSYKGKVVMVVNVASKCGLTKQYAGLESLYQKNKDKDFVVMGFPANNFNNQEPGTNAEIAEFCSSKYNVTFPMMSKISVKGADMAPLYSWLIAESTRPNDSIEWNFAKFLIDKKGYVRYRFAPNVLPESNEVNNAIKELLAEKVRQKR